MPYNRLVLGVVLLNAGVLWLHLGRGDWRIEDGSALSALAALTLVNMTGAVLIRQQTVLNALFGLAGRGSRGWPLWLRWSVSKVHHVGGIHAGAALAGTAWLCAFAVVAVVARARHPASVSATTLVLLGCLVALALLVVTCAAPAVRSRAHNVFELSHRFGGWTAIALFWALTVHLALRQRGDAGAAEAIASSWHVWILAVLTASVASPWLRLRRVPVTVERPSAHAVIVSFDHGATPAFASAVGISRSPLREWHAFATVATPGRPGFRVLISRAGDWTGRFIDDPPSHVWVRGKPVSAPMAKVALLYERVVYVVTGSGIGPCLGQILADRVPARLVWSTRDPRRHLRRRARGRGGGRAARRRHLGHDAGRQARPRRARPARGPGLRRGGRLRGQQQARDAPPRARPRAARDPRLRAHLGLLSRSTATRAAPLA